MFNKSILITGCDSGIGLSLCKRLIKRNYYIIAVCKTEVGKKILEEVFNNFKNELNSTNINNLKKSEESRHSSIENIATVVVVDITSEKSIKELVSIYNESNKINKIPNLYAIINNAAIWKFSNIQESCLNESNIHEEVERWKSVITTNLLGSVSITLHFISYLKSFEGLKPRILFISSALDECALPCQSSYISSKFAIRGFHESLLHELDNTRIFSICISPGAISNTNLFNDLDDYTVDKSYKLKQTQRIKDGLRKLRKLGSSIDGVVNTVISALESRKPKTHYKNTSGAFIFRVCKLLPKFIYIKIVRFMLINNNILDNGLVKIALKCILN